MDSRYGAFTIPRRPVTSAGPPPVVDSPWLPPPPPPPYSALPDRPPLPPRLRSSKSVAQLHVQQQHHHYSSQPPDLPPPPHLSREKQAATLPPGFVFQEVAPPAAASAHSLPPPPLLPPGGRPVRRAKSSVDLRRPQTSGSPSLKSESSSSSTSSSWKKALDEAQYLAGGLISSPVESTRHHSIIRHSGALVWYRGPDTAVTITVLSDEPLPPTRALWLQQKGFSGSVGMSLKAMVGTTGDWLDVTPAAQAQAAHIPASEERGIQRDLRRFARRAAGGRARSHLPRETHIVRIPAAAQDGYFRIVLPVFRLASTSADVSVMRGAGLRTMPLEVGAKVASAVAATYVSAATGAAAGAARMGAGKVAGAAAKKVAARAYRECARAGAVDAVKDSWLRSSSSTAARYERAVSSAMMQPTVGVVGPEAGPEAPFPIKCAGRVVAGTGYTLAKYGFPTANLAGVPEELTLRMAGSFAAWARPAGMPRRKGGPQKDDDVDDGEQPAWREAVVTIGPAENATPSIVRKNVVAVHILHELDDDEASDLCGSSLQLLLMGFLGPLPPPPPPPTDGRATTAGDDAAMQRHADHLLTTLATLSRPRWRPEPTLEGIRARKSGHRTWSERLDGVTGAVAARVDSVPVHRAGIRSEAGALRDASFGNGGLWIQR
ncbi:LipA and NB-ARC domain-containing protein [Cordyceps javanica]|uniref:Riboflavin kinase n=1 Tax=Cordyceps javanica TaxID=43265 RepID=A0A545USU6_9HYPO|nr:LipA and NB-ARC domain-containing protein [Cordyceps javanica]